MGGPANLITTFRERRSSEPNLCVGTSPTMSKLHKVADVCTIEAMDISAVSQAIHSRFGADLTAGLGVVLKARLDGLAVELAGLYRNRIPTYETYDVAVIEESTRIVLGAFAEVLTNPQYAVSVDGLMQLARDLADDGVPLGSVAHSVQIGTRRVSQILQDHCREIGASPRDLTAIQDVAWEWATEAAAAIQAVEQEFAIADASHRADFIRRLVSGDMSPADLDEQAPGLRIDANHQYHVAVTRAPRNGAPSDLLSALRLYGASASLAVVDAVIDRSVVALVPRRPDQLRPTAPVGLGPQVEFAQVRASYHEARTAHLIAERHHIVGLVDLSLLGPLPLLDQATVAGDALDKRHLAPLRRLGDSGTEVLTTVTAFLTNDRRLTETAEQLHVHRNTVSYRLNRFVEVTGLDVRRTNDLVVAWWLLNRQDQAFVR